MWSYTLFEFDDSTFANLDNLIQRCESMVRWDSPLFTLDRPRCQKYSSSPTARIVRLALSLLLEGQMGFNPEMLYPSDFSLLTSC